MLRIVTFTSEAQAKRYHMGGQSLEAYYSEGQEFVGYWVGKGAQKLGLNGRVDKVAYDQLCENINPVTGERLTQRMNGKRRVGFDISFGVPKSVSLLYAYTRDERILRAFRQAVHDTHRQIEEEAAARVRAGGRDEDVKTGNLISAEFIHFTGRPVDGIPDPHLHAHYFVFNATFDEMEGKWKALQMGNIHDEADHYQWLFYMRLKGHLRALGLEIEPNDKSFEIAGIWRELIEKFSRRTELIEAEAKKRGITDPAEKDKLGALTREKKAKKALIADLEPEWWARLTPEERKTLEHLKALLQRSREHDAIQVIDRERIEGREWAKSAGSLGKGQRVSLNKATRPVDSPKRVVEVTEHDRRAVAFAMEHIFERQSVVTEKQLMTEAFKSWCVGRATTEGIQQVVAEARLLRKRRKGKTLVTTKLVLAEEKRIYGRCIEGKEKCPAMNPDWVIQDETLNRQQQEAVRHVLSSKDLITGIAGKAGTGKTTLLREARRGIEASGNNLTVLAPTAEAAHDVLRKQGFKNAETVAQLLQNEVLQEEARGSVWLVDEAGLLSARQADRLLALAAKLEARVVFVGDTGQHHAVERGQAFDLLQRYGHMAVANVDEIQRQKGAYKEFVEQVAAHKWERAFRSLDGMKAISETTIEERRELLAKDYVAVIERGKTAQVVAPTHAECNDVTQTIRQALKERHVLKGGSDREILRNLSWTQAEKSDADHYNRGLVVQINGHVKGFALGEQMEVIGVSDGMVRVRSDDGYHAKIKSLPLSEPEKFGVYKRDTIEVCEGDCIRITSNGRTADGHRLQNRNLYKVDYIGHDGAIVLENGYRLDKDFAHLDYGYASTSHAAQGKTVDWVFVAQTAQLSSCASDAKQFYVSVSRGREGVKIYTDDIELLKDNVSRVRERPMATEMMQAEQAAEKQERYGFSASELLGQNGLEITEDEAQVLREVPALEWKMEITVPPPALEREHEQEMVMEMSM